MKKIFFIGLLPMLMALSAQAEIETNYLFNCNLSFTASGKSVYLVAGYTKAKGTGTLSCYDYLTGNTEHIPIKVSVKGLGLGIGVTGINISGSAVGIGIKKDPESLLGKYGQIKAGAAIGQGAAASAGVRFNLKKGAALITVSVNGQSGLGAGVDLLSVDIEKLGQKHVEKPIVPKKRYKKVQSGVDTVELIVKPGQKIELIDKNGQVVKRLIVK